MGETATEGGLLAVSLPASNVCQVACRRPNRPTVCSPSPLRELAEPPIESVLNGTHVACFTVTESGEPMHIP
jgi:hypothetical protein